MVFRGSQAAAILDRRSERHGRERRSPGDIAPGEFCERVCAAVNLIVGLTGLGWVASRDKQELLKHKWTSLIATFDVFMYSLVKLIRR